MRRIRKHRLRSLGNPERWDKLALTEVYFPQYIVINT